MGAALLTACISTPVQPAARSDLMVARAGDEVQLVWTSQSNVLYTITASDTLGAGARWQPLPHGTRLRGTGRQMTLTDLVPAGRPRYYDLVLEMPGSAPVLQRSRATNTPNSGR